MSLKPCAICGGKAFGAGGNPGDLFVCAACWPKVKDRPEFKKMHRKAAERMKPKPRRPAPVLKPHPCRRCQNHLTTHPSRICIHCACELRLR